MVFLGDLIQTTEVYAKAESTVLLPCEEDRHSVWRSGGADKPCSYMFIKELSEGF